MFYRQIRIPVIWWAISPDRIPPIPHLPTRSIRASPPPTEPSTTPSTIRPTVISLPMLKNPPAITAPKRPRRKNNRRSATMMPARRREYRHCGQLASVGPWNSWHYPMTGRRNPRRPRRNRAGPRPLIPRRRTIPHRRPKYLPTPPTASRLPKVPRHPTPGSRAAARPPGRTTFRRPAGLPVNAGRNAAVCRVGTRLCSARHRISRPAITSSRDDQRDEHFLTRQRTVKTGHLVFVVVIGG